MTRKALQRSIAVDSQIQLNSAVFKLEKGKSSMNIYMN